MLEPTLRRGPGWRTPRLHRAQGAAHATDPIQAGGSLAGKDMPDAASTVSSIAPSAVSEAAVLSLPALESRAGARVPGTASGRDVSVPGACGGVMIAFAARRSWRQEAAPRAARQGPRALASDPEALPPRGPGRVARVATCGQIPITGRRRWRDTRVPREYVFRFPPHGALPSRFASARSVRGPGTAPRSSALSSLVQPWQCPGRGPTRHDTRDGPAGQPDGLEGPVGRRPTGAPVDGPGSPDDCHRVPSAESLPSAHAAW
jgi:hypothetical protein